VTNTTGRGRWQRQSRADCDSGTRTPTAFGGDTCGPMANKNFASRSSARRRIRTGSRVGKAAVQLGVVGQRRSPAGERRRADGGLHRTTYGNFTVTRNTAVTPADYTSYCIRRRPIAAAGQRQRPADLAASPTSTPTFGIVNNVVTLASNFGRPASTTTARRHLVAASARHHGHRRMEHRNRSACSRRGRA